MAFNLEALDDPLAFDASAAFDGGQVSNTRASLLLPNQVAELFNCDLTQTGQLVTRRGSRHFGQAIGVASVGGPVGPVQGLAFYDTPSVQYLVAAAGASLWKFNGTEWERLVSPFTFAAADAVRQINFAQGINKLYLCDGNGHLYAWDGSALADISTSGTPPPVGAKYLAWHSQRLCLAGMTSEPDAIYFSDFLDGTAWDSTLQQLRVGGGDGDPITGLAPWTQFDLLVLKRHSIWVVNCNPLQNNDTDHPASVEDFAIQRLNPNIGCVANRSAVQVADDIWFLSDDGVRSAQRSVATDARSEIGAALSYPVQDIIDRITASAIGTSAACYWNHRYMLAIPLDGSSRPNYTLVYNTLTQSWSGLWTGWTPTAWTLNASAGQVRLNFGQADGTVAEWLDYVHPDAEVDATFQDAGADISTSLLTRAFLFQDPVSPKTGFNCEMEFNGSQADCTVEVILDDAGPLPLQDAALVTRSASLYLPLTLPFTLPRAGIVRRARDLQAFGQFRELQFSLTTTSGKLALRSIMASAFIDTMVLQQ